ncbi:MAG TPA: signal peptidase II [Candidatus Cloacimonetes bacterium]|nr:signal peptidase II [Candidatus Cloacimonadota bacterium]
MKKIQYIWITILVILLDQISKLLIRNYLDVGKIIEVTKKIFWLHHVENTGAAFSISLGNDVVNRIIFICVSIIAIVLLIYLNSKSKSKIEKIAFALILGGAIGNLIDRIIFGKVTDFLSCDFPDIFMERWPVFNIADSSIVIAITIMIVHSVFFTRKTVEET